MIRSKNQSQSGGDGSTNVQAQNIYVSGVTASEARQIAIDVFNANIEKFSSQAADLAVARAENLTERFINSVCEENPNLLQELKSPGMQLSILNAQRETARSGESYTEDILVSLLIERTSERRRTLRQIAIEEAITVASKLTDKQIDMLTANLFVNHHYFSANSLQKLEHFLSTVTSNFRFTSSFRSADVSHLEFTGCAKGGNSSQYKSLDLAIRSTFPGLFQKQFSESNFAEKVPDHHLYRELLIASDVDSSLFTLNAVSVTEINNFFSKKGLGNEKKRFLFDFQKSNGSNVDEIRRKMLEMEPRSDFLFSLDNREAFSLDLSPVGVAIATANFHRKIGLSLAWPYHMRNA